MGRACRNYDFNLRAILYVFIIVHLASSPSSDSSENCNVFISYRGSHVEKGILAHLKKSLTENGINVCLDNQLLEQAEVAIVIFSPDYARSEGCREELLKISESTKKVVIPVFSGVDPSQVQSLTGNYTMAQLKTDFNAQLVEKWGAALKNTTLLAGFVSSNFNTELNMIGDIVKHVVKILNSVYPSDPARDCGQVGIDSRVEKVKPLLDGPEEVSIVGILGEDGIGKTTLAHATFDRVRSQFDYPCFVGDVRENCEKLIANGVFPKYFGMIDTGEIMKKLRRKKVILVFDDVSNLSQVNLILRYKVGMGCGSRIIATSRDIRLLIKLGAKIYPVEKLNDHEALELFWLHAFRKKVPEEGFLELSERAVQYAQGLPSTLKILGSNLFNKSIEEWEDELEKFRCFSGTNYKRSGISYHGLSNLKKEKNAGYCSRDEGENLRQRCI